MNDINFKDLISPKSIDPTFFVNFHKIERPAKNDTLNKFPKTSNVRCWKIENQQLIKLKKENIGILFDEESYIVQWLFDLVISNQTIKESLVYYWKGQNAPKGYTPLPPELEEQCPVERIVQWSEPAIFFCSFQKNIVFSGKEDKFDINIPHLLLARGEISDEIHFYEVPCNRVNLRSRTSFLLIVPEKRYFLYWHGSQTSVEYREKVVNFCNPHNYLKTWENSWSDFLIHNEEENQETTLFLDVVNGNHSDFIHIHLETNFSPKLFYLNTITGTFLATKVEYSLRAQNEIAAFPFLQSHLYTALQPALFLVDNNSELWLWEGANFADCNNKTCGEELRMAEMFQKRYAEEKEKLTAQTVTCFHVYAYKEPLEFKNIFPLWVES